MTRKKAAPRAKNPPQDSEEAGNPRLRLRQGFLVLAVCLIVGVGVLAVNGSLPGVGSHGADGSQTILNPNAPLATFYTPTVMRWSGDIFEWARKYGVNPNVIAIVIQIESCGDLTAISGAGALGLMQVMPFHFDNGENMINPDTNVENGMAVFYECLMQFAGGDLGLALACYNGGPSVTVRDHSTWAAETQHYYEWATGLWDDVVNQRNRSETLENWLAAGGQRLCNQVESAAIEVAQP